MIDQMPNILTRPDRPIRESLKRRARQNRLGDEARSELVEGYRCGASVNTLAKLHEIHRTTVLAILERSGVNRRPQKAKLDSATVGVFIALYGSGLSLASIAERFKVDPSTIGAALKRAGVSLRQPGRPAAVRPKRRSG